MYVKPFCYERAGDIGEAIELLQAHGSGARILAGGQSLLPLINLGLYEPEVLIDVGPISELKRIEASDGALVLGAMSTHRSIELDDSVRSLLPLLAEAVRHVGNTRVRNMGTVGGSIVHNDPVAEIPLVLGLLNAEYELADGRRRRTATSRDFPTGPFETAIEDGELLTRVEVPLPASELSWGFREFAYRPGDFAVAAAAVVAGFDGRTVVEARVGITGLGSGPVWCAAYEEAAVGRTVDGLREIEGLVTADLHHIMDGRETGEYRVHLVGVLTTRALEDAFERSAGGPRS